MAAEAPQGLSALGAQIKFNAFTFEEIIALDLKAIAIKFFKGERPHIQGIEAPLEVGKKYNFSIKHGTLEIETKANQLAVIVLLNGSSDTFKWNFILEDNVIKEETCYRSSGSGCSAIYDLVDLTIAEYTGRDRKTSQIVEDYFNGKKFMPIEKPLPHCYQFALITKNGEFRIATKATSIDITYILSKDGVDKSSEVQVFTKDGEKIHKAISKKTNYVIKRSAKESVEDTVCTAPDCTVM